MTSLSIHAGDSLANTRAGDRARLDFRAGHIVPRVIEQGALSARVALVAGGALLLGGDHVSINVTVGRGCTLVLEDIGGTVAYDADGEQASWAVNIHVEAGATLMWHSLPMVVAHGANVSRSTSIQLGSGARALLRETVVLGRSGEVAGHITMRTDVTACGAPVFVEELSANGASDIPGVIGATRVLDSVLLVGERMLPLSAPPRAPVPLLQFEYPGTLARYLGAEAHRTPLDRIWSAAAASQSPPQLANPRPR